MQKSAAVLSDVASLSPAESIEIINNFFIQSLQCLMRIARDDVSEYDSRHIFVGTVIFFAGRFIKNGIVAILSDPF